MTNRSYARAEKLENGYEWIHFPISVKTSWSLHVHDEHLVINIRNDTMEIVTARAPIKLTN